MKLFIILTILLYSFSAMAASKPIQAPTSSVKKVVKSSHKKVVQKSISSAHKTKK